MNCTNRFSLRHICDDAIGDNEKDEVLWAVGELPRNVGHMIDRRREVGRAVELNACEATLIGRQNSWNGFIN